MVAIDTNVLVRFLTGDDPTQEAVARSLFATGPVWIPKTVLLETGWVLSSLFGLSDGDIREAFIKLLGLKNVRVEDEAAVSRALAFVAEGLELADAIHLGSRPAGSPFVTFDKAFVKRAQKAGTSDVSALPGKLETGTGSK
jgi:predicted nucleic-acid-binding protein